MNRSLEIFYVTCARLPTEKAHGLATIKIASAFAERGARVTVFAPYSTKNSIHEDLFHFYSVPKNFKIVRLPSINIMHWRLPERLTFLVHLFSFSIVAAIWLGVRYGVTGRLRRAISFSHDHVPLFFLSFITKNIYYDVHHYPERTWLYMRVLRRAIGIAVQTKWKVTELERDFGVPREKIVYWPNGTDVDRFAKAPSRTEARKILKLPPHAAIIVYSGQLFSWKGVDTFCAASYLTGNAQWFVVGGSPRDITSLRGVCAPGELIHVTFVGQRPWSEVPLWLHAADILILPNTGRESVSAFYTSPMKLFEYMASGRPIIASDLPSVREILDESMAYFVAPDDPAALAEKVAKVLLSTDDARARAERAQKEVRRYTWPVRAEKILEQIGGMVG
jgi:glycosyltransferase involved in cell wall biosynthesis